MTKFKILIFDFDGTMISSMHNHWQAWRAFANQHNITWQDDFMQRVAGKTESEALQQLWQQPLSLEQAQQLNAEKQKLYEQLTKPTAIRGLEKFISQLAELQIAWAIGSGASRKTILSHLQHLNLVQDPAIIVCADDALPSKPAPDIFLAVAAQLNTQAQDCLVFEDSETGLLAAYQAGMQAIAVCPSASPKTLALPHIVDRIRDYNYLLNNNFLEKYCYV